MKTPLLFCLILVAFGACKKAEKRIAEPPKVHEINIGILAGTADEVTGVHNWQFYYYWHLDLVNDSFYVKHNPSMMGDSGRITLAGGKLNFQNEPVIKRFLEQEKNMGNGAKYFHKSEGELYCFPTYVIQYKKDAATKFIFFNEHKYIFGELTDFINNINHKGQQTRLITLKSLKDNSLAFALSHRSDFDKFAPVPLLINGQTIKFTPPVKKK